MSDPAEHSDDAVDQAFAEAVAQLGDVELAAKIAAKSDENRQSCPHTFTPEHMALVRVHEHLVHMSEILACTVDREQGVDCDHRVDGKPCPLDGMDSELVQSITHQAECANCTAQAILALAWPFAVASEAALTLQHLMVLRARSDQEGNAEAVMILSEAIDNLANARHRPDDHDQNEEMDDAG